MKTPKYWQDKNLLSKLLYPLGKLYLWGSFINSKIKHPKKIEKKVICIGNLTAGGTGKTPCSVSIAKILQEMKYKPFFVSRGYGGKLRNILVDKKVHSAQDVGDEPLLLSNTAPVAINPNRYLAAQKALEYGADIIIMDDGFQNQSLQKDISFLVFDGEFGCGNGYGIPAGPMREDFASGIKKAQAIIILGKDKFELAKKIHNIPIFYGTISPIKPKFTEQSVIAFAGIGRPQKFYNSLIECGLNILETIDFPDHHQYKREELLFLIEKAQQKNCVLYTTSKDFVKFPKDLQKYFNTLEIEIKWQDANALKSFLSQKI